MSDAGGEINAFGASLSPQHYGGGGRKGEPGFPGLDPVPKELPPGGVLTLVPDTGPLRPSAALSLAPRGWGVAAAGSCRGCGAAAG